MGDGGFLNDDWLEAQRNYWAEWSARVGKEGTTGETSANPWEQALNQWWQTLAPTAPLQIQELLEKTLAQGRQLFQLAEKFVEAQKGPEAGSDWQSAVQQTFGDLRGIIAAITGTMNPLPEELLSEATIDSSRDYMERLFALPGLGLGHHGQTQQREMISRLLRYQKARQAYEGFLTDLGNRSISRLQDEIASLDGQGAPIDSARTLYDVWVSACDGVYTEQAMTAEYVKLYGELINSQMAVKQQMRDMLDETFTALGMPTTRAVRALEQRAHQDRQAIKALRAEVAAMRQAMVPIKKRPGTRKKAAPAEK